MEATGHRERRPWTEEEDQQLREAIQREDPASNPPSKWHAIATHVPNRTNKDCRKRWWAQMATTVAKGGWSAEEDDRLCVAVEECGTKWALVATRVGTRNSGQCAKRWNDALNPAIDRSEWTDEEDVRLLEAVKTQGKSWTNIVRATLPGRTGLAAKNRYNHLTRATSDRGRERRKNAAQPYSRSLGHIPPSQSTGSTPPHLSRAHTPITPADAMPPMYAHYAPKPEGGEDAYGRPALTLAQIPGGAPYSPHPGLYPPQPHPGYRLAGSPADSPRSAYPGAAPPAFFPGPQTSELHRGGYHSSPSTPAPVPDPTGPGGYFQPNGVSAAHAAHLARNPHISQQQLHHQQQQQQQQQHQLQHHHHQQEPGSIALYPAPGHSHASHASASLASQPQPGYDMRHAPGQYDVHGHQQQQQPSPQSHYRLPSMQSGLSVGEWPH